MKIECRDCWAKTNVQEDTVAYKILSYPEYGAGFVIRSASSSSSTTTTKDKVESKIAKDLDKDREQ